MVTLSVRMGNPTEPMTQGLLALLSSDRAFWLYFINKITNKILKI